VSDNVKHPSHYTEGRKFEPKDVIYDWGLNFNLGSAVKYISRAGRKDDAVQDLKKAQEFIQFEIDAIEAERAELAKAERDVMEEMLVYGLDPFASASVTAEAGTVKTITIELSEGVDVEAVAKSLARKLQGGK
jgi:hypothetical protein